MIPDYLKHLQVYKPGKPIEEVQRELGLQRVYKLASNENPLGPPPEVLEALKTFDCLHLYPDAQGRMLRKALSQRYDWPMEGILLGNGSEEIIAMIARAYCPHQPVLVSEHGFAIYAIAAQQVGAKVKKVPEKEFKTDVDALLESLSMDTAAVFLANPNNPTGTFLRQEELKTVAKNLPDGCILVVDEAYFEYVDDPTYHTALGLIREGFPILVTRTFSKIYGMASLRLGFCLGDPTLVLPLAKVKFPFNTSGIAQFCGQVALQAEDHVRLSLEHNKKEKQWLLHRLADLPLTVYPTHTNFLLLETEETGETMFRYLLHRGIIVRPLEEYGLPNFLRVTVGRREENKAFIEALQEFYA